MQRDMVQFRPKLAAILLLSELNMKKRCVVVENGVEENVGSPSYVVIGENPAELVAAQTSGNIPRTVVV